MQAYAEPTVDESTSSKKTQPMIFPKWRINLIHPKESYIHW